MTTLPSSVDQAIERGIGYLHQHQYPNGEFCCYIAADDPMQAWCVADSTIFPTALIATSLLALTGHARVEEMLDQTVSFLRYQVMRGGVCHHFTHLHPLRQASPADIDDTAYVSNLLRVRGVAYPYPHNIRLLLANRNRQGLFYTWFVLRPRWQPYRTYWRVALKELKNPLKSILFWYSGEATRGDIDGVVNANVLYYLGDCAATQPVIDYLLRIIDEHREADCDKWYRRPFSVYYFLSRSYWAGITRLEPARQVVIDRILATARPDGCLGNTVLDTALGVCALIYWKSAAPEIDRAIDFIVQTQQPAGNWPRWLLYYGGPKKLRGWGSEELTTGFCLEALALYRRYIAV